MKDATPLEKLIGANLKRLRVSKKMTLQQVAEQLVPPISKSQIGKYEVGHASIASHRIPELAAIVGADIMEFYLGADKLMKGQTVVVTIPCAYESDIVIHFRKVKNDFKPHVANLIKGVCKSMQMP